MYFVRRFFELCKFLLKIFTSLKLLYSASCCVLQGCPPQPSCSLVPCEHTLLTAHKAVLPCAVTSQCLCSESRHLPVWHPPHLPWAWDQAAMGRPGCPLCTCPSYCAPALAPRWAAPPPTPGCPFSWALRPWAGLSTLVGVTALLRLCHLVSGHTPSFLGH